MKAKNIPNILSVIRILMSPAFAAIFIWRYPSHVWLAGVIFALAGITDVLDGILARRFGWITQLGKILDPIADKLMQCTALLCMVARRILPLWLFVIILAKELCMASGTIILFKKSREVGVSKNYGKAYTVVFYFAVIMFLIFGGSDAVFTYVLCALVAVIGICVTVLYYINYLSGKMGKAKNPERNLAK